MPLTDTPCAIPLEIAVQVYMNPFINSLMFGHIPLIGILPNNVMLKSTDHHLIQKYMLASLFKMKIYIVNFIVLCTL